LFHQEHCLYHGTNHKANEEDKTLYLDHKMSKNLRSNQAEIYGSTNFDNSKLAIGVPCARICILLAMGAMLAQNPTGKYDRTILYASKLLNKVEHNHITT
jgi:hypothetical protein